jgi:preprotein translocase subunit SecD
MINLSLILLSSAFCFAQLFASAQATNPGSRFELRRAQSTPAEGLIEMNPPRSDQKIFVYAEPIATADDILDAVALEGGYARADGAHFEVHVTFTQAAAERLAKFTQEHTGEMLAIIANGKLVSAPTIRDRIYDRAVIAGNFTEIEANELAKLLNPEKSGTRD